MSKSYKSVWDALIDDADEADDQKKRSDYLILIRARLNGQPGSVEDKAKCLDLPVHQVRDLVEGKIDKFNLPVLIVIARKLGITAKV